MGRNQEGCGLDRLRHAVDGAEGHAIELRRERFCALGVDFGRDPKDANCLLKKGRLLALRLGQGYGDFGAAEGDGNPREAGALAKVKQGGDSGGKCAGAENRLHKMPRQNTLFVSNCSQVDASIPAKN